MSGPSWRRLVRYAAAEPAWWTDTPRAGLPHEAGSQRLGRLLASVGIEAGALDRPVAQLSTGERQRLALVRALLDEPRVLLLDEPTASLDAAAAALVEELIRFQLLAGRAVLLASHDLGTVARLAHVRLELAPRSGQAPSPRGVAPLRRLP